MKLPIDALRAEFEAALPHSDLVLSAPTGSGKSTRVPLWCHQAGAGPVLVVEPRRVACRRLAQWVAEGLQEKPGKTVGYAVRFEQRLSPDTQVRFVTPGVALGYAGAGELPHYATIVIDEFHERGLETDLFLPLARKLCPDARMVLMSATLEGHKLQQYLGGCWLRGEGRRFPVELVYLGGPEVPNTRDLVDRVAAGVRRAWKETEGSVLVFLPGMRSISEVGSRLGQLPVVRLHGSFSHQEQDKAFQEGVRQIILSTNVAESSVTVPGVTAVVDSGLVKQFIHRGGHSALSTVAISNASAEQRRGRAGRLQPGRCYRCWSEQGQLLSATPPELTRIELTELVLKTAAASVGVEELSFVDPPPEFAVEDACERLRRWQALDGQGRLTHQGKRLAQLPLPAARGRLLLQAPESLKGLVADLLAVLESRSGFFQMTRDEDVLKAREQELSGCPPVASVLALRRGHPRRHALHPDSLTEARRIAEQLRSLVGAAPLAEDRETNVHTPTLAEFLARAWPERAYVKRKTREAWGNGFEEVVLGRDSDLKEGTQAAIILEVEPMAGRGLSVQLRGRNPVPCSFSLLLRAGLGEPQLSGYRLGPDGTVVADISYSYAGRELGRSEETPSGAPLRLALARLILDGKLWPGVADTLAEDMFYARLAAALDESSGPELEAEEWLCARLAELGVEKAEDQALIEAEDLAFAGLQPWEKEKLQGSYPRTFHSGEAAFEVGYDPRRKRVTLHWQTGRRNAPISPTLLPRWNGWSVWLNERGRKTKVR